MYEGAPHGLMSTHQQRFNADLLDFAQQQSAVAGPARRGAAEATPLAARGP